MPGIVVPEPAATESAMRPGLALFLAVCALWPLDIHAQEDGYYYPPIGSEEVFERDLAGAPPAARAVRTAFITEITRTQLEAPAPPRFAIFAKGGEAEHMIIVALDDEIFRTLQRARAVLAQLTAGARATAFFERHAIATTATWFDLAKLLGFKDIVISDGVTWSHRIALR